MAMRKLFGGAGLRNIRDRAGLAQKEMAARLGISVSYYNQMENNHRPLTAAVMVGLAADFDVDLRSLWGPEDDTLLDALTAAAADPAFEATPLPLEELQIAAAQTPALARAFLHLHQRLSGSPAPHPAGSPKLEDMPLPSSDPAPATEPAPASVEVDALSDHPTATGKTAPDAVEWETPGAAEAAKPADASPAPDMTGPAADPAQEAAEAAPVEPPVGPISTDPPLPDNPARASDDRPERSDDVADETSPETIAPPEAQGDTWALVQAYFEARHGYIDVVDRAAERFAAEKGSFSDLALAACAALGQQGITVRFTQGDGLRRYDAAARELSLPAALSPEARRFQLLRHVAFLTEDQALSGALDGAGMDNDAARALTRVGLANYYATAVMLPYEAFRVAARDCRHDLDAIATQFGATVEQVAHRLSTLNRPAARGLPFRFARIENADAYPEPGAARSLGEAPALPLADVRRICEAPDRVHRRVTFETDGSPAIAIARAGRGTTVRSAGPERDYAIVLTCDATHAGDLVYADGLDLTRARGLEPVLPRMPAPSTWYSARPTAAAG